MSVRNPTTWTTAHDQLQLTVGTPIRATQLDWIINDQIFVIDAEQLVISDTFIGTKTWSDTDIAAIYTPLGKNLCGSVTGTVVVGYDWCFKAFCSDGSTSYNVTAATTLAADSDTIAVPTSTTSPTWFGYGSVVNMYAEGAPEAVTVTLARTAGTGTISFTSFGFFAKET